VTIDVVNIAPLNGVTDSNGYVEIQIPDSYVGQRGRLHVQAQGYQSYSEYIQLESGILPDIILLDLSPMKAAKLNDVQIEGDNKDTMVAYSQEGFLWRRTLEDRLDSVKVFDLDRDGEPEIVLTTHREGERPGYILIYDQTGAPLDEYNVWKTSIYAGGQSDKMTIVGLHVADLTNDGTVEIVALAQDTRWYPSRLAVLQFRESRLVEVSEYWHPGLLGVLDVGDLDGDSVQEVVCVGENNDLKAAVEGVDQNVFVVFLLNGAAISGQAPPWFGDAPRGSETWYAFMEPGMAINGVDFEDWDGDGILEVHVLSDNCSYYVDYAGTKAELARGTGCSGDPKMRILRQAQE
jgi:hypothetical protein